MLKKTRIQEISKVKIFGISKKVACSSTLITCRLLFLGPDYFLFFILVEFFLN